jgi:hypothetical protein
MWQHSPRAFPLGVAAPVGTLHGTHRHSRLPRARRPRPRTCFRKGCGRKYQPRCWNQRYCQDPECLRQVRRWQDARRQAKRRRDDRVKAQHAQAEKERRQRAKTLPKSIENPEVAPARGHAALFFSTARNRARISALSRVTSLPGVPNRWISVRHGGRQDAIFLARGYGLCFVGAQCL